MNELVKGVWLARSHEAIETVNVETMTLKLLASWDGTEVIRQDSPQGKKFSLLPVEGWTALEHLFIIQGEAVWEDGNHRVTLGPGDSLTGKPVQEPCILTALTDLVSLYVVSQPVFHQVSGELRSLQQMADAVEIKDGYTADHCKRIQTMSRRIGQLMHLSPIRQHYLLCGSYFHDLGKVKVPDAVLKKPGKLTDEEWHIMKQHTIFGNEMLRNTSVEAAGFILAQHHERIDGSGYPHGLKGDEISLEAQIVAVVDSFDAMTTDRVYHPALDRKDAFAELRRGVGTLYRADVVDAFFAAFEGF